MRNKLDSKSMGYGTDTSHYHIRMCQSNYSNKHFIGPTIYMKLDLKSRVETYNACFCP